jgi:hypothetical protein
MLGGEYRESNRIFNVLRMESPLFFEPVLASHRKYRTFVLVESDDLVFNCHVAEAFVRFDCCGNCPRRRTLSEDILYFRAA